MICRDFIVNPDFVARHAPKIRDNHGEIPLGILPEHLWLAAHGKPVIAQQVTEEEAIEWLQQNNALITPSKISNTEETAKAGVTEKVNTSSGKSSRKG